jgi:hypothetical protein
MKRPIGITILAVLSFLVGAFYLLAAIGFLASVPFGARLRTGLGTYFGWLAVLIGVVDLLAAYGLWTLRPWGWGLMVALVAVNLGAAIGILVAGFLPAGPIFSLTVNGFILWYLLRAEVKAAFGAADLSRQAPKRVA